MRQKLWTTANLDNSSLCLSDLDMPVAPRAINVAYVPNTHHQRVESLRLRNNCVRFWSDIVSDRQLWPRANGVDVMRSFLIEVVWLLMLDLNVVFCLYYRDS